MNSKEVVERVKMSWKNWIPGTSIYIWEQKLKLVKETLKDWVKTNYVSPTILKEKIKGKLA
jgi:hypothetical protein